MFCVCFLRVFKIILGEGGVAGLVLGGVEEDNKIQQNTKHGPDFDIFLLYTTFSMPVRL